MRRPHFAHERGPHAKTSTSRPRRLRPRPSGPRRRRRHRRSPGQAGPRRLQYLLSRVRRAVSRPNRGDFMKFSGVIAIIALLFLPSGAVASERKALPPSCPPSCPPGEGWCWNGDGSICWCQPQIECDYTRKPAFANPLFLNYTPLPTRKAPLAK